MVARVMQGGPELVGHVRAVFGLPELEPSSLSMAGRGAMGRLWRLDCGPHRYALKELFRAADADDVRIETAVTARLSAAGVPLPDSMPAVDGRFLVQLPEAFGGDWVRLYRWIDGTPVDPAAPGVATQLGELLGRLHASALPPHGDPDPWFETTPDPAEWELLVDAALAAGLPWAPRLAAMRPMLAELAELVTPMPVEHMITCHRDLHPDNVLADQDGRLVLLDWDIQGPACPDRELAIVLVRWHFDNGVLNADAVRATMAAYRAAGGTGQLRDRHSFGMSIAADLNFLRNQARVVLDPAAATEHREFAEREVLASLVLMTTVPVIDELLDLAAEVPA